MKLFTTIDKIKDPIVQKYVDPQSSKIMTYVIQMPLELIEIKYYDWLDGTESTYDELLKKYPLYKVASRFICSFKLPNIENELCQYMVRSVNIWTDENVAQIELSQWSEFDNSAFLPYMKVRRIYKQPDIVLSY